MKRSDQTKGTSASSAKTRIGSQRRRQSGGVAGGAVGAGVSAMAQPLAGKRPVGRKNSTAAIRM
jgi:hypothetical protein